MNPSLLRLAPRCILLGLSVSATAIAWAQLGDRPRDEAQRPPSADLAIPPSPVLSPAEALRGFVLPPGFRIELVAAEPLVRDPVMMVFDERGRAWVAELGPYNAEILTDYPDYLEKGKPKPARPPGRVVVLEDTDGDGCMDKRTVYAEHMNLPRAIAFYGDQVLIGDPPNLWLTRDTDGDGTMDEKTLLASDYGTPDNVEASANGLLWGRDNWLYNASYPGRWRQFGTEWRREPMPSLGQWGMTQDDFGRLFYNNNSEHLRGDLLPSHHLGGVDRRLPLSGANYQVATDQTVWPLRPNPGVNRGYRRGQLREDGTLATFTAAAAPVIYRGTNFPTAYAGNVFVPEPAANLIKRSLVREGEGLLSVVNAYHGVEFLTSSDERFRPVYLANAPDGALYVVDYYRGMLESYAFATTYLRDQIIARNLNSPPWGLGRIYRIVHESGPRGTPPDFSRATPAALVRLLGDANGWTRDRAQRRIVESGNAEFAPLLREYFATATRPAERVAALWCLEGLNVFTVADAARALEDADWHVRVAGVRAAEKILRTPAGAPLVAQLTKRVATETPIVLAHAALAIGNAVDGAARDFVWSLLRRATEDPLLTDAVLFASRGRELDALERVRSMLAAPTGSVFGGQPLLETIGLHLAVAGGLSAEALAAAVCDPKLPSWGRFALMRGATKPGGATLSEKTLQRISAGAPDALVKRRASELLAALQKRKAQIAARPPVPPLDAAQQALFEVGRTNYGLCASCHQPDGLGKPGVAPSLRDGRWANAVSPDLALRIVLRGKEGSAGFAAPMVPLAALSDEQLAGILTYVRRSFGNQASAVLPKDVARVRIEIISRNTPWTDVELEGVEATLK